MAPGTDAPSRPRPQPPQQPLPPLQLGGAIREEEEGEEEEREGEGGVAGEDHSHQPSELAPASDNSRNDKYVWRVDLSRTECHWRGWFDGLSKEFLSPPVPKLLILAGVDRLDKDLTIGQMQGWWWLLYTVEPPIKDPPR